MQLVFVLLNMIMIWILEQVYVPALLFSVQLSCFFISKKYKIIIDTYSVSLTMLALNKQN